MASSYGVPCPKPEPRKTAKARETREARKVVTAVRARCVERDGACRVKGWPFGECVGPSEWAHLEQYRRFKTRGQRPEQRHTTAGSVILCRYHHHLYDAHQLEIHPLTTLGADGTLRLRVGGVTVLSIPASGGQRNTGTKAGQL